MTKIDRGWFIIYILYFRMAVNFAHKVRARRLILNHFSQRYQKYERVLAEQKDKEKEIEIPTDRILLNEGRERAAELGLKNEKDEYLEIAEDLKMFNIKFRWSFMASMTHFCLTMIVINRKYEIVFEWNVLERIIFKLFSEKCKIFREILFHLIKYQTKPFVVV